jgi:hypothetical protein
MFAYTKLMQAMVAAGVVSNNDPYFNLTTLLLNTTATNGAQNNTFLDSSTNNFTITRNGNTTQGTFTPFSQTGWSNYFNGSNSYMTLGGAASLALSSGDFEISLFAYWNSVGTQVLYEGRPGSNGAYPVILTNSSVLIYFVNSVNAITGPTVVANQWYYITVSRVSGTTKMFVNGSQVGSNYTDSTNYATGGTAPWIGAGYAPGDYMNGYISNLRVVVGSGVTSQTVPTTPLTAITNTKLLTCQSNRFVDSSASPLAITVNGTPSVQAFSPFAPTTAYSASVVGGSSYGNAATDYLNFTDSGNLLDLGGAVASFECWYYPIASSAFQNIFLKASAFTWSTTNGIEYAISLNSGAFTITYNASGTPTALADPTAKAINQWYHLVVATDASNNISLFVNGVRVANATNAITKPTTRTNMYVGAIGSGSEFSKGYISGVSFIKGSGAYNAASTTITVPTAPPTVITNTALLLNYTNSGIFDSTAKNVLETVGNAQVSTTQAKWGTTSMYFDGTGDWLLMPDSPNLQLGTGDFTIEGWVYLTAAGVAYGIISKGAASTGWSVNVTSGNKLQFSYTATALTGATSLAATTWYYFAVVRSGSATGNLKVYLNGSVDATSGGAVTDNFNQTNGLYVGADRVAGSALNGYLDEVRVTKYARTITTPTAAFLLQ